MEEIKLNIDENNELVFDVNIQSSNALMEAPIIRLLLKENDISYVFYGKSNENRKIDVVIPPMGKKMSEGIYDAVLEVIVENKIFEPMKFKANFQKPLKVEAKIQNKSSSQEKNLSETTVKVSGVTLKELYEKRKK